MRVYVLLYDAGKDSEGIHSIEVSAETLVLMFENKDDAERYAGLLEAQDFPVPSIEELDRDEVEAFCAGAGYKAKIVSDGFIPKDDEERILLAPPELNKDVTNWKDDIKEEIPKNSEESLEHTELDDIKKKLEGLL
ncbi:DUF3110 domain-containing protein [Prochlorococcus sp. MIT 1300]|uniref:DUF3110 domain-containing protein n=1 Tax=Prochlorococcus sp. MIT 1300 TaxID=3096218 RepID=UPI002A7504A1|nr:DUF3110 domain-containing protein [Prochlorococcus sp. MIT 1300]